MCMCRARSATAPATTGKPSRCTTRARPSPKCWTCRSRKRRSSSSRSPASTAICARWSMSASGYVRLGQPAPTLSGGEAQRVKLASELQKRSTGRTVYILDEPTTGLHFDDIRKLLTVINGLVDKGNTVIVIEHNLDVIKTSDWIVDMGPEGGAEGGTVVAQGTPEDVAAVPESYTGKFLAEVVGSGGASTNTPRRSKRRRKVSALSRYRVDPAASGAEPATRARVSPISRPGRRIDLRSGHPLTSRRRSAWTRGSGPRVRRRRAGAPRTGPPRPGPRGVSASSSVAPSDVAYRVSIFSRTDSKVGTPALSYAGSGCAASGTSGWSGMTANLGFCAA